MFGEHMRSGPGANYRGRVSYAKQISYAMAWRFTTYLLSTELARSVALPDTGRSICFTYYRNHHIVHP
ncbi:unnamed protein product [Cochlearia groenlandica]